MATNKNQHFVPRCYLRTFTIDANNTAINLFNIDRKKFIQSAAVKHQCSSNYFYGKDEHKLEDALQYMEKSYAKALKEILSQNYSFSPLHKTILRRFWLLQYMRTEAASKRAVEMTTGMGEAAGVDESEFKLEIREAVYHAMKAFSETMHIVDDLKVCLFKNHTKVPFITSDDPAILANRWHQQNKKAIGLGFGLQSAGSLFFLPLSPNLVCVGYDGDVYSIHHKKGWVDVKNSNDVQAINQHQLLNCRANVFIKEAVDVDVIVNLYNEIEVLRPKTRHIINYAVLDKQEGEYSTYTVVKPPYDRHQEAIIHSQAVHHKPSKWPRQLRNRTKGIVYSNGTGIGYVRETAKNRIGSNDFNKIRA